MSKYKSVLLLTSCVFLIGSLAAVSAAEAGPAYDHDRKELEAILDDLLAWLPGEWSSAPQIHYERTVRMPAEGEHEAWYRTFARIDAPQIGPYVLYGQINLGGRDGPLYPRSQLLYKVEIDEKRGVVLVNGQGPADPEKYVNLQDHPELWKQVKMRDESLIKCDFIWRRDGEQIVGVLDGPTEERRKGGPGTCSYLSATGQDFFSDAEWTLTPETLWLYDINLLAGQQFIGRKDRTHIKLNRVHPFACDVRDKRGSRAATAHDRGFSGPILTASGASLEWTLLRARYPAQDGFGLEEEMRLSIGAPEAKQPLHVSRAAVSAPAIAVEFEGGSIRCVRGEALGPMPVDPG